MPSSASRPVDLAVVLAGGTGSRLGRLTADTPKPLLPVAGRPFVTHVLAHLEGQGIKRVVLATGYLADRFEQALGPRWQGLELSYSREETPLGTGGALARALGPRTEEFAFVVNGDTYFPLDYSELAARRERANARLALALRHVPDSGRFGAVELEGDRVVALREKDGAGAGLVNGGTYLVDRAALLAASPRGAFSLEKDLFPPWVAQGLVAGLACEVDFIDIGIPESLAEAGRRLGVRP